MQILQKADDTYGTGGPFNSVFKLQVIVDRAKTLPCIHWTIASIVDDVDMGYAESSTVGVAKLKKVHVPIALLKMDLLDWLLSNFMETHPFKLDDKALIRKNVESHVMVHKTCIPIPGDSIDTAWKSKLHPA
eukprot:7617108-Lingulodinium_polyedra.AAC.1